MISSKRKIIAAAMSAVFVASFGATSISNAEKPSLNTPPSLGKGYILAYGGNTDTKSESGEHSVMKKDKDGKVSLDDFMQHHKWMFQRNDVNKDGFLDNAEMHGLHKMVKGMHKRHEAK